METLSGRLLPIEALTKVERDQMFALMQRHYAGVSRSAFGLDLAEKNWVIVLQSPASGAIRGFSTQMLLKTRVDGRDVKALFSGDTIVDQSCWGQQVLTRIWGRLALDLIDQCSDTDLFWFLIAKGYKTYRFLPVFFNEYFPLADSRMPSRMHRVRDSLALLKYPDSYDPARGIIPATGEDACRLRPDIAPIADSRLRDPHVRFFNEANPGHPRGDELCCIAPLTRENFTPAAWRAIGEWNAAKREPAQC